MSIGRRVILASLFGLPAASFLRTAPALAAGAHDFSFDTAEGKPLRLADFAGKVILIVNTASRCGFATQLNTLETLWSTYKDRGLMVIGVPSGDFGNQELASNAEIKTFCAFNFGVTFPLAVKTSVRGPDAHPFYRWAAEQRPRDVPSWNFHKYLIDRDGQIAAVFPTSVDPMDRRVVAAVEATLAAGAKTH